MPWTNQPPLPHARSGLAAATCRAPSPGSGHRIYAIGGTDTNGVAAEVDAYDPSAKRWSSTAPMKHARWLLAAAVAHGRIHALGGSDSSQMVTVLATHEIYDPGVGRWSQAASLPTPRTGLAAVTSRDGHIYALGGNDAQGNALPIVEAYDPVSHKWKTIKPMSAPRTDLAAVTGRDGLIYAIGGANATTGLLKTVEVFDGISWKPGPSLPVASYCLENEPVTYTDDPEPTAT